MIHSKGKLLLRLAALVALLVGLALSTAPGALSNSSSFEPNISPEQAIALAVNDLTATDDGYQLRHPRHTAAFTAEGLTFTPRRGGPEWHWQLTHVGAGARGLAGVDVGAVAPVQDGPGVVAYPRGGLTEQYLAQANSIEQRFVIPGPLALGGADLVVAGAVRSAGELETTPQGWLWRTAEGVVSLGDVRAYGADGRELPATMEVMAKGTRIVVDGAALARAAYPVTIDPEVGTNDFRISDMGPNGNTAYDAEDPAVAYNSTNNEYLVVWQGDDTTNGEFEIFGQRINAATGAEVGTNDFRLSDIGPDGDAAYDAEEPAVASNSRNEDLVVWSGDNDTDPLVDDEYEIFGQRFTKPLPPPPVPVGGVIVPVNRLGLLTPWLGLTALASLVALGAALLRRRKA